MKSCGSQQNISDPAKQVIYLSSANTSLRSPDHSSMLTLTLSFHVHLHKHYCSIPTRTKPTKGVEPNQEGPGDVHFKDCHQSSPASWKTTSVWPRTSAPAFSTFPLQNRMLRALPLRQCWFFFFFFLLAVDFLAHLALSVHFSVMTVFYQASFGHSAIANC